MLRDLTVQNYRCFEDFHIDGLEQVNLFVGNNNSGKTSLLEAIYLFASSHKKEALFEIIRNRLNYFNYHRIGFAYSIKELFNQYELDRKITINTGENIEQTIKIFQRYSNLICIQGEEKEFNEILEKNNLKSSEDFRFYKTSLTNQKRFEFVEFVIDLDNREFLKSLRFGDVISDYYEKDEYYKNDTKTSLFLSVSKNNFSKIALMWDQISLTAKEDKVIEALQIIEPSIERIGFASSEETESIRLKKKGQDYPIPLSNMGEGMYRILTLSISLVTAENGVLLVDEIETGLHYEAQTDMWRLILETAKELNVQVFATTHSWDCIAAFQEALSQVEDKSVGKLFRLDSKYGQLRAVEYNAEDLGVAVRESIEVR